MIGGRDCEGKKGRHAREGRAGKGREAVKGREGKKVAKRNGGQRRR